MMGGTQRTLPPAGAPPAAPGTPPSRGWAANARPAGPAAPAANSPYGQHGANWNQAASLNVQSPGYSPGGDVAKRTAAGQPAPAAGSESGPGILESWFNQRASGTDPGWEYGMGRAADSINKQYAARGGYNSSAATQSLSDMYANSNAQREGQLDTLAGAASGEHQGRLNNMFTQGLGLANGQSNTTGGFTGMGVNAQSSAAQDQINLLLGKSGIDQKKTQGEFDALGNLTKLFAGK